MSVFLNYKLYRGDFDYNNVKGKLVSFINPYSYLLLRNKKAVQEGIDVFFIDGISLYVLLDIFFKLKSDRYSFDNTSLSKIVFKHAADFNEKIYFVGAKKEEIEIASSVTLKENPGLKLIGYNSGYFENIEQKKRLISEIIQADVDILVVGMGTLIQEEFLIECREQGFKGTGFTCGGFFHQTAKKGNRYYPSFFDKMNVRWVYRMWDEPKLIRRYVIDYPRSFILLFFDLLFGKAISK